MKDLTLTNIETKYTERRSPSKQSKRVLYVTWSLQHLALCYVSKYICQKQGKIPNGFVQNSDIRGHFVISFTKHEVDRYLTVLIILIWCSLHRDSTKSLSKHSELPPARAEAFLPILSFSLSRSNSFSLSMPRHMLFSRML